MNFPASSILKGVLLKGSPLLCGSTGVSIGGWQCYENSSITVEKAFSGKKWIDIENFHEGLTNELIQDPKKLSEKDNSCYSRYLKKSPFNIALEKIKTDGVTVQELELSHYNQEKEIGNLNEYDSGCIIGKFENNSSESWAEILLWKKESMKATLLYFFNDSAFNILRFDVEKSGEIKLSERIKWTDVYGGEFLYGGKKINNADLILENGKDIKISIKVPLAHAEIKFEGETWNERNKYCEEMKQKNRVNFYEIKKVGDWCISK